MKLISISSMLLLFSCVAFAECDAPFIDLPNAKTVLSHNVKRFPEYEDYKGMLSPGYSVIKFMNTDFIIQPEPASIKKLGSSFSHVVEVLKSTMKSSEHYYGIRPQSFEITQVQGFDLNSDGRVDLSLFEVDGVYTGALGHSEAGLHLLVEPMCC